MTATQTEFDFGTRTEASRKHRGGIRAGRRANSPHHKTTILTVSRGDFGRVRGGGWVRVCFCNDIVSSCRGEPNDSVHHSIRRIDLLKRQAAGGYEKVKVRCDAGVEIDCRMSPDGPEVESDGSFGTIAVCMEVSQTENK